MQIQGQPEACKSAPAYRSDKEGSGFERRIIARQIAHFVYNLMDKGQQPWSFSIDGQMYTVRFDDLLLIEIRKVSEGSYQPVLAFFGD